MKDEYDFENAERGKFFFKEAILVPPVRLDAENLGYLQWRAKEQGVSLDALVNALLKTDIQRIKTQEAARAASEYDKHSPE